VEFGINASIAKNRTEKVNRFHSRQDNAKACLYYRQDFVSLMEQGSSRLDDYGQVKSRGEPRHKIFVVLKA